MRALENPLPPALRIHTETTPNPNSVKWVVPHALVGPDVRAHFDSAPAPEASPLAARLFAIAGVSGVSLAGNVVTVSKRAEVPWAHLGEPVGAVIRDLLRARESAVGPAFRARSDSGRPQGEVARRVEAILAAEIRPAVALDGGDVVLAGFRDGVVELYLRGSCSGCPSSTATLKLGIEARLREAISEVEEVVAL